MCMYPEISVHCVNLNVCYRHEYEVYDKFLKYLGTVDVGQVSVIGTTN